MVIVCEPNDQVCLHGQPEVVQRPVELLLEGGGGEGEGGGGEGRGDNSGGGEGEGGGGDGEGGGGEGVPKCAAPAEQFLTSRAATWAGSNGVRER